MSNEIYNPLCPMSSNRSVVCFTLLIALFLLNQVTATAQTPNEKKVDYLERIYFSGENKEGLNNRVFVTLKELQQKPPTDALAAQVTFLVDIKDKASEAANACDILDLLAVGIYSIDAAEAVQQGVRPPTAKAKAKTVDAIASLGKLNSTSNGLSSSARNLEWSSYLLSGGKYGSFASGAGKIANTAGTVGAVAGAAGQAGQTVKDLGEVGKSLGLKFRKADKPCDDVAKKDIQIGEHLAVAAATATNTNPDEKTNTTINTNPNSVTSTTVISIQGINSSSLRALADTLKSKPGIQSIEKSFSDTLSTITVAHSGNTDVLAEWLEDKFGNKFKLVNYASGKINLTAKK